MKMHRRILFAWAIAALFLTSFAPRTTLSTPQTTSRPAVSIPFELVTRHIVVKVRINDSRPLSFVFDTGDKMGIVDIGVAKELGLKLHGQIRVGGAGSETLTGSMIEGAKWTLPGLDGFSQPVALAIPLNRLASRFGHDFDGIIGSDFIKQFVVEVDYPARVLRFHDKDKFSYTGNGEIIPIRLDQQGHPIIEAEVTPVGGQPIKGRYVLDLGSGNSLALHSPFVNEHRLLNPGLKTIRAIGMGGAGGQTNGQIGRVAEMKIGSFKLANVNTLFSEDKAGAFANSALAGNIGQRIASRFKVFLDYGRSRIILEPTTALSDTFDRAYSGMALSAEGKNYTTLRITEVLENSPASEVGLQKDDLIIKVNDKPASELTITKLGEMFERAASYQMTIQRGDQTMQVTLKPRKLV
jgi:aspartyl protease/PDZ domain-containing protein